MKTFKNSSPKKFAQKLEIEILIIETNLLKV